MNWTAPLTKERFDAWMHSRWFSGLVAGVLGTLVLVLVFEVGVAVGFHRAAFSYHLEQNYGRTFGRTTDRVFLPGPELPSGHGAFGRIVSVSLPTITIASDGTKPEQEVHVGNDTVIRDKDAMAGSSALTVGSYIVVLGTPNDAGQVDAKLIRLVPPPPADLPQAR